MATRVAACEYIFLNLLPLNARIIVDARVKFERFKQEGGGMCGSLVDAGIDL